MTTVYHILDPELWKKLRERTPTILFNDVRPPTMGEYLRGSWTGLDDDFQIVGGTIRSMMMHADGMVDIVITGSAQTIRMYGGFTERRETITWNLFQDPEAFEYSVIRYNPNVPSEGIIEKREESLHQLHLHKGAFSWEWLRTLLANERAWEDFSHGNYHFPVKRMIIGDDAPEIVLARCRPEPDKAHAVLIEALKIHDYDKRVPKTILPEEPLQSGP